MRGKLVVGMLVLIVLLMDFSNVGLMAASDGEILSELAKIRQPKVYVNSLDPSFRGFENGTPVTVWEEEIIDRVIVSPLGEVPDADRGMSLGSNIGGNWFVGVNATGKLSEDIEEIFLNSMENVNRTGTLVLAVLVTDISVLNETLFSDERVRIVVDEILKFAEEVGDASIVLTGNYCTAMNLMYLLWLAEKDRRVNDVYLIILTHGILNETSQVHGMLMHGENNIAVVNGETLEYLAEKLKLGRLSKLKFVYLPFCNMGKEREIYGNRSVVAFFEKHCDAQILAYDGETYLNGEYIASIQSVLSSGTYELVEEHVYLPVQVVDNFTGEVIEGYVEFSVSDEIKEVNSMINPYEIYDNGSNVTLGFGFWRGMRSKSTYRVTVHRKNVKAIIHHGHPPKNCKKKQLKHISYKILPKCKTFGKRTNKVSKINFRHKTRSIPVITGRFWRPPKVEKRHFGNTFNDKLKAGIYEIKSAVMIVDEIFNEIYKNYYAIKSAIYRWIDATFNAPWNKWIRSPVKSTLDNTVFQGTNFVINFAKQHLKTVISIAYHLKRAGKSLAELIAALIIAMIARFARSILKYFSWTMNMLLKTLSNTLGINLSWVEKILRNWIDSSIKFLNVAVAYNDKILKSAAKKFADTIVNSFNYAWNHVKRLLDKIWTHFLEFSVDNYLTLVYLLCELSAENKISKKLAKSILDIAGKILDFILNMQPVEKKLNSWVKIYYTWFMAAFLAGKIRTKMPKGWDTWKIVASRDGVKTNRKANGYPETLYKMLYDVLNEKVKHMNFLRTDDIIIVVRKGWELRWYDAIPTDRFIKRIDKILWNTDLKVSKLIEFDDNGKIKGIILDRGGSRHLFKWLGEIQVVQVLHTHIDGNPVEFVIVWEGYLSKWFKDPALNKKFVEKNIEFERKLKNEYRDKILISDFIPCKIETGDLTLKGYRILIGVMNADPFKNSYRNLIPAGRGDQYIREQHKKKMYRFDGELLGDEWEVHLDKVKTIVEQQAAVWRKYIDKYSEIKGEKPLFFDVISQTIFETHLTVVDGKVEGIIQSCDPPFLREPIMTHVDLTLILDKIATRLESKNDNEKLLKVTKIKSDIELFLKENFEEFYKLVYRELPKEIKSVEKKYDEELSSIKNKKEFDKKLEEKSEEIEGIISEKIEDSGPLGYLMVHEAKGSVSDTNEAKIRNRCRIEAKKEVYGQILKGIIDSENLGEVCREIIVIQPAEGTKFEKKADQCVTIGSLLGIVGDEKFSQPFTEELKFPENIAEKIRKGLYKEISPKEMQEVIPHQEYLDKVLSDREIKSRYKEFLGKITKKFIDPGTMVFAAIFATVSLLGHRLGAEIYKNMPNNAKSTLKSGYGKIKNYVLLACVSFILLNIDDYQDFINNFRDKKESGSLKNVVKVLLQTFLGCVINGMLLQMLIEDKNSKVILADDVVPYIARNLFGNNAWIFEKIIWPIISTAIQVVANGGPITYLTGTIIGIITTKMLNTILV
ncbi:MAG: hypothetical protein Q6368_003120 [Candidatus Baldrarchaeota archaeon]